MSLLTPKNLNSVLPIPNGSLLKKVDDDNFIEATQADIIALGFTPWGGTWWEVFTVIAWLTDTYISLPTERFTGSGSWVQLFPKSFVCEQPWTYTITVETDAAWPNFYDVRINWVQSWPWYSWPWGYQTVAINLALVEWDVVWFSVTKGSIWPVFWLKNVVVTYDKNIVWYTFVEAATSPVD